MYIAETTSVYSQVRIFKKEIIVTLENRVSYLYLLSYLGAKHLLLDAGHVCPGIYGWQDK